MKMTRPQLRRLIRESVFPLRETGVVHINSIPVEVEIADDAESRNMGLMFRHNVPDGTGMLFFFPLQETQSFWMKNTFVPLSIAFIDGDGFITNIERMTPHSLNSVASSSPVPFALEVRQGWFEENGIAAGCQISGLPSIKKRDSSDNRLRHIIMEVIRE
jgi:uncharacterized membrane protein (UPF0127 family)